jgi:hypothetical protein
MRQIILYVFLVAALCIETYQSARGSDSSLQEESSGRKIPNKYKCKCTSELDTFPPKKNTLPQSSSSEENLKYILPLGYGSAAEFTAVALLLKNANKSNKSKALEY